MPHPYSARRERSRCWIRRALIVDVLPGGNPQ